MNHSDCILTEVSLSKAQNTIGAAAVSLTCDLPVDMNRLCAALFEGCIAEAAVF